MDHDETALTGSGAPAPDGPPWLRWQVGERVVVRYRLDDAGTDAAGRPQFSDALGDLLEVRPDGVVIRTRRGDVEVPARTMVTGKRVPPPPDPARYRQGQPG